MSGPRLVRTPSVLVILAILALALLGGQAMGDYWMYVLAIGAVGAWSVAALAHTGGALPLLPSMVIGAGLSVLFGLLCALPALRLRSINLAVVTLGVVLAVYTVGKAGHVPGSQLTLYVEPPVFGDGYYKGLYWLSWISFAVLAIATVVIRRTRMGLSWLAIARSERAAAALGISVLHAKMTAFAVAAAIAGWARGLLVAAFGSADPANFEPVTVLTLFVLAVMMGAGLWEGALALGMFNAVASALLRKWGLSPDIGALLFGIGAVQILAMESGGFSYDIRRLGRWIWGKLRPAAGAREAAPLRKLSDAPARMPRKDEVALTLEGLTVRYGALTAVNQISFQVHTGEIVGLTGPNGAGKSTLVDAVTGFTKISQGTVEVAGRSLVGLPAHRRATLARRTFQTERTIEELAPRDYLRLAAGGAVDEAAIDEVMAFVACPSDVKRIGALDVRLRRLLTIGGCLVQRPRMVLIDEPAAGLTAAESEDLSVRIREIPHRFDCGVLLIEHDMELVRNVCDRLVVLDFGQQIAQGETAEVLNDPRVLAAYLGEEIPDLQDDAKDRRAAQWAAS